MLTKIVSKKGNYMKEKRGEKLLFRTMLVLIPIAVLVLAVQWGVSSLVKWHYNEFTKPFLAQSESYTHSGKNLNTTSKELHIEYTVLKVPTASKTAAKK